MKKIILILTLTGCSQVKEITKTHTYETDDTCYLNGEILYPDYVQSDTLIVIDAPLLNWCMEHYDIASDGDIADVLRVTTKRLNPSLDSLIDNDNK